MQGLVLYSCVAGARKVKRDMQRRYLTNQGFRATQSDRWM
jgi:hypothetical protein